MINNPGIGNIRNLLSFVQTPGKALALKIGAIVKAEVIDVINNNQALLRVAAQGSRENQKGTLIRAFTELPLTKGQRIFLEVLGGKNKITMRFMGDSGEEAARLQQKIPPKILNMLSQLSLSRPGSEELHRLLEMIRALPPEIRNAIPELRNLEKLFPDIKQIDGKLLRAFIESSGVAMETKLRIAFLNNPGSLLQSLMTMQSEGDLKLLLLKLQKLLKDRNSINTMKQAGFKLAELSDTVEKLLKNIEFFQLTSKLNDMFYTFLPLMWHDLRDGEFLFRKNSQGKGGSYICDINLDLQSIGKLSISLTMAEESFHVTFSTERRDVMALIQSQEHMLESRFSAQGLPLKVINVNYKSDISFGKVPDQGINVKI